MHIYIHIPFCTSKCPYCAFGSHTDKFSLVKKYFQALHFEIKDFLEKNSGEISTLFIGGGTPSSVNSHFYAEIFNLLKPHFSSQYEATTEANPNSATLAWLEAIREFGVNRVSFGAQSFNEQKLKFLGRNHSAKDTFNAVKNAKIAGFDNINIDLIYSTKFDTKAMLEFELENIAKLSVPHISAYSLTLEENTPFSGKKSYKKDSIRLDEFLFSHLLKLGFNQYEISNFSKNSFLCKHNLAYWEQKNYAGFGAYAVGFKDCARFYSPKSVEAYIKNPLLKTRESIDKNALRFEHIFLGARCKIGINAKFLNQNELKNAQTLAQNGKLKLENSIFYNPNFALADEIALFITSQI
ncbi:radical SAM family heme chaperone HemW [Campylobacter geochelonis]|uniref:radical SAM family heme chaperone HemW n=1 Tax=Campylobacter geochelonis TaxID=1780362 RepID=UPI000770A622|nr:radical SAM family heme chaperone HemW [Campylobacter geochelonis]CZE50161.1 coproporphyrinogen III oxidase [Campylobacter geochelonis]